jgi:hypothetical protein
MERGRQERTVGDRCGEPEGRRIVFSERLTHQVLADLAGAHRATVTTLLNDWLYDGILTTTAESCFCLQNPVELWALAGYNTPAERERDEARSR